MTKSGPNPRSTPSRTPARPVAIAAGGILGLLAAAIGAQQLFFSDSKPSGGDSPEQVVDRFLEHDRQASNAERHQEVDKKITRLLALTAMPGFGQLPKPKQDAIRNRHRELRDYQEYEKNLARLDDPRKARTEEQLKKIKTSLTELRVPPEYLTEWSGTLARDQHTERLAECEALEKAVRHTVEGYQQLLREGQLVLKQSAEPRLPQRAKEVLDRARELPDPKRGQADFIPDTRRIPYTAVFQFSGMSELHGQWLKLRKTLEDLAGLGKL
jgi:NADH dehydrogenase/NADH:ubiquinone oxidoreductase subunit G